VARRRDPAEEDPRPDPPRWRGAIVPRRHGTQFRSRPRILSVIGTRQTIHAAPVSAALATVADEILVHIGSYRDEVLLGGQLAASGLPQPHHYLGIARTEPPALAEARLVALIDRERPDAVLVRGGTNATLSGARAADATGTFLIHVEAGLRRHRDAARAEHNRIEIDRLSQLLLAPTPGAAANLIAERVTGEIHVTGDPLVDIVEAWTTRVERVAGEYVLAIVHRDENAGDTDRLRAILGCLARSPWPVVFPLEQRARLAERRLEIPARVRLIDPLPYDRLLAYERGARAIATDSGDVQREAYLWGVPCVTLRSETEWADTVAAGWNTVVGVDPDAFARAIRRPSPAVRPPIFGDGRAAERIAQIVVGALTRGELTPA
jgi:UDP-N-acetylglucosamine 2-epimerase (non-hydrolysing)/UDP-GlcNAc3NAcA epimerase